ncbi:hypothetical protein RRG08_034153 [Elysia crispata]|uniref:Uncharacterized protein n=1 Tax=Elysia crispata TaxID=231223 RepID=A0AAE1DHW9_9GAST|nr:hypothetical protein RRG08_034153 [Elysia crispata]
MPSVPVSTSYLPLVARGRRVCYRFTGEYRDAKCARFNFLSPTGCSQLLEPVAQDLSARKVFSIVHWSVTCQ